MRTRNGSQLADLPQNKWSVQPESTLPRRPPACFAACFLAAGSLGIRQWWLTEIRRQVADNYDSYFQVAIGACARPHGEREGARP